jgi:DNA invertase Pin-like site-specific DNA recombinase
VHQLGSTDLTSSAGKLLLTMLAAVAEMERDLLIERTQAGLARARSEGKVLGRPSKTTPEQRAEILRGGLRSGRDRECAGAGLRCFQSEYHRHTTKLLSIERPRRYSSQPETDCHRT